MSTAFDMPEDRYYDAEHHLWARRDEAGSVRIGMDALGLESLGQLAYVALEKRGTVVERGDSIGTLESEKMTSKIVAPISGELVGRNEDVLRDPHLVNREPYGAGWLLTIDASRWDDEAAALLSGAAIRPWVEAEVARYRAEGWME